MEAANTDSIFDFSENRRERVGTRICFTFTAKTAGGPAKNGVLPAALLHAEAPERLLSLQVLNSSIVTDRSLVDSQSIAITHHLCASNQEGASLP